MSDIKLCHPTACIHGKIKLGGSKSITNRVYIIRSLCAEPFEIYNASDSEDSRTLLSLLSQKEGVFDAGHAGTTFRFLTALFAFQPGIQVLTGSERMQQRPIGPLVDALNTLGARIEYLQEEGFPPIKIHPPSEDLGSLVKVSADISSQFISALLLVAPTLPHGLEIQLEGPSVSASYLEMTINVMKAFGVEVEKKENTFYVKPQPYKATHYSVEADWSSASYFFSIAAIAKEAAIELTGLHLPSLQGDSAIVQLSACFGVNTAVSDAGNLLLTHHQENKRDLFLEYDFINQPDLAQTIFVMCGATSTAGLFNGLKTLKIKETDRLVAMQNELEKVGVFLTKVPSKFHKNHQDELYMLEGSLIFNEIPSFKTYGDHRMAMALAPLALKHAIIIKDAGVIEKSYPDFWQALQQLGFEMEELGRNKE